ncbi:hypothetical protein [Chitinophaga sp.]|uniref:hypothetical protein n=1 Tax=Chitinophaga sp. TaxID=1869181 RepID=UPI0031DF928E
MSDSQFTIVLGALRSIEEKLNLRFMAVNNRIDKLEKRLNSIEIKFDHKFEIEDARFEKIEYSLDEIDRRMLKLEPKVSAA